MDDNTPATKGDLKALAQATKGDIEFLRIDMSGLKTDVTNLRTDVTNLQTDVTGLKTDVAVLKTDVTGLKTDVAVLKTDVKALKKSMNEGFSKVHEDIDRVLTVLINIDKRTQGRLDDHEERIEELEGAVVA